MPSLPHVCVDGSSEGGRINTINLPARSSSTACTHPGTSAQEPKTKLSVAPVQADGVWCLELSYQETTRLGSGPLARHRVVLRKLEPPPSA